jgi:potassium-transporting ATPase ATP-binding subunit
LKKKKLPLFSFSILAESSKNAFKQLLPQLQIKNPVMFVTYLGAIFTSAYVIEEIAAHALSLFNLQIALWLWFTVLFANFAQSLAESRGKAQAAALRTLQASTWATKLLDGREIKIPAFQLKKGDKILCKAEELIPADGEVIEGIAAVDESAITGESAPVIRESGGDRSAVTAGTKIISDSLIIQVTAEPGDSFLDRIIQLVESAKRQKTPNEIALTIVLSALTIIFLLVVTALKQFSDYSGVEACQDLTQLVTLPILISLLVCLIPTTISALLSAIGIAGMSRLIERNVIAKSGRSVEAAGDIDLLLLDKTGTITLGNRMAVAFLPAPGVEEKRLAELAQYASLGDETPEGRSIVILAKEQFDLRPEELDARTVRFISFSARTRMSGVDFLNPQGEVFHTIRKGAVEAIVKHIETLGGIVPASLLAAAESISKTGGTPLLVSEDRHLVGVIHLKDIVKGGIRERFSQLRKMGIRTVMVTGDNPITAVAIAAEAGVDDFIAQATPELKLARIEEEQQKGHLVAMAGDGTNDAPALAKADVGVAMNTGTIASREAGNMVDLESNPTKLIEIVEIGKQLLMTRGALTTFSIANDVAKYFAIIPALFGTLYATSNKAFGPLAKLNLMRLASPQSAILSAVIFNALIIVLLIPIALRGVGYRAQTAYALLAKNVLIYGLGGIVAPFIGIKLIDMAIISFGWVA